MDERSRAAAGKVAAPSFPRPFHDACARRPSVPTLRGVGASHGRRADTALLPHVRRRRSLRGRRQLRALQSGRLEGASASPGRDAACQRRRPGRRGHGGRVPRELQSRSHELRSHRPRGRVVQSHDRGHRAPHRAREQGQTASVRPVRDDRTRRSRRQDPEGDGRSVRSSRGHPLWPRRGRALFGKGGRHLPRARRAGLDVPLVAAGLAPTPLRCARSPHLKAPAGRAGRAGVPGR